MRRLTRIGIFALIAVFGLAGLNASIAMAAQPHKTQILSSSPLSTEDETLERTTFSVELPEPIDVEEAYYPLFLVKPGVDLSEAFSTQTQFCQWRISEEFRESFYSPQWGSYGGTAPEFVSGGGPGLSNEGCDQVSEEWIAACLADAKQGIHCDWLTGINIQPIGTNPYLAGICYPGGSQAICEVSRDIQPGQQLNLVQINSQQHPKNLDGSAETLAQDIISTYIAEPEIIFDYEGTMTEEESRALALAFEESLARAEEGYFSILNHSFTEPNCAFWVVSWTEGDSRLESADSACFDSAEVSTLGHITYDQVLSADNVIKVQPGLAGGAGRGGTGWSSSSVLSALPLFGDVGAEALRLGATTVGASVLAILVALPTQLLNSALERLGIGSGWFMARFRRRSSQSAVSGDQAQSSDSDAAPDTQPSPKRWGSSLLKALPVFVLASIITGFVDPAFGFNWMSARLVLTALVAFLLINYLATALVLMIVTKRINIPMPTVRVQYSFLLLIALTVLGSRLFEIAPPLVFGTILAIETGRVVIGAIREHADRVVAGRIQTYSAVAVMVLGALAYVGYNLTASMVTLGEFFAALTIESLTTLPLLMLPLTFMPGATIFRWNKWVSLAMFAAAMTLFMFVLVPFPASWETVNESFTVWMTVLTGYIVFALAVWGIVALKTRITIRNATKQ